MASVTVDQAMQVALEHHRAGRLSEAEQVYRQVLAQVPAHAVALHHLGLIAHQMNRNDVAVELIRRAIVLRPDYADAYGNLGIALKSRGDIDEAITAYRQAIALRPDYAEAYNNLGNALKATGQHDEAIAAYRQAISLQPDYAEAYGNLGLALGEKGQIDEAVAAHRQAIALNPNVAEMHGNLGLALKDQGELDAAIAEFRQAMALKPGSPDAHSNLVYTLHFHPSYDARMIAEEHRRWQRAHAEPLKNFIPSTRFARSGQAPSASSGQVTTTTDRNPDRRLRVGYISPDFREHPVGRLVLPLLAHHDKSRFEIFAYAQVPVAGAITEQFRSCVDCWRNIVGLSDGRVADLIRDDKIDILVDLTMHMANNRLLVFARKPAPVQVTYLAYCSTTGLETIDYRLSDPFLDPPTGDDSVYSEKTVRLPETYWCYQPSIAPPNVGPLPALESGGITFGCLNNFCKVSEPALSAWAELLRATPNSTLLLHAHQGSHRDRAREMFQQKGVDPSRLEFVGFMPAEKYFDLYRRIDIALDTFPHGGGTTTFDALWMGVPVISLAGKTAVGRGGLSILSNIGLPELVARSTEEYVRLATELAGDLPRLGDLRSTLRRRMEQSPLMDAPHFARNVEATYRQMWQTWLDAPRGHQPMPAMRRPPEPG